MSNRGQQYGQEESDHFEYLPLKDQLKQSTEESRVVLPGVQALFGFQLIAVFNQEFAKRLSGVEQRLHLLALAFTAIAAAITMAPSAMHRQTQPHGVSTRLVNQSTTMLAVGMAPLVLSIVLDFYLLSRVILGSVGQAMAAAGALFLLYVGLWYLYPAVSRSRLHREARDRNPIDARRAETVDP